MKRQCLAFYAPLKAPDHAHPSGDRHMASLLMQALRLAGFAVDLASHFRSYDRDGNPVRQQHLCNMGQQLATRLLHHYERMGSTPDYWFTYHLYHKAPDWIGPQVTQTLHIPYIVAEASSAPSQEGGLWARGHRAVAHALGRTDLVVHLNPDDEACVAPLLDEQAKSLVLPPFMDLGLLPDPDSSSALREQLAQESGIDPIQPWLVCAAMMRPGDKFASYQILARSLYSLQDLPWQLLVIGDGKCHGQIKDLFADFGQRCHWLGQLSHDMVLKALSACDLYLWPGINEAYGLALLEAQACGLPVVTGDRPGPATIVLHQYSGLLVPEGNVADFVQATRTLLENTALCRQFAVRARAAIARKHGIRQAAATIAMAIRDLN